MYLCSHLPPEVSSADAEACIIRLGKRKRTPPCSSEELLFAEENGGHRGKIEVVDMALLAFIGFCIYHRPGKFFFEARKVLQKISFGGVVYTFSFSGERRIVRVFE